MYLKTSKQTRGRIFTRTLLLVCVGSQLQSCDIEDLTKSITEGVAEEYVIRDKNKGELQVTEAYEEHVAAFTIEDNPYGVSKIEFTADGYYHITFSEPTMYSAGSRSAETEEQPAMTLLVEGRRVKVCSNAARSSWRDIPSTGTYTVENGRYVLMDYHWEMIDNSLKITDDDGTTHSYSATPVSPLNMDALTLRLCHKWTLARVLLKLYNDGQCDERHI